MGRYTKQDLNLEQTWLGREVDNLLLCVNDASLATGKARTGPGRGAWTEPWPQKIEWSLCSVLDSIQYQ